MCFRDYTITLVLEIKFPFSFFLSLDTALPPREDYVQVLKGRLAKYIE